MKRYSWIMAAMLPLVVAGMAMGQTKSTPRIAGTRHNFGANGYAFAQGEICKPCHTPHNAADPSVSHAFWAHTLSTASYKLSDTELNVAQEDALDNYSRLCMSCHDGTVALDSFAGGTPGTGPALGANSVVNLGTDLSNDHPVGKTAVYNGNSSSFNSTTVDSRGNTAVGVNDPTNGKATLRLYPVSVTAGGTTTTNNVVSCGTCHNPHGAGNTSGTYPKLLRMSNVQSQMCLTCHIK
jgi:predicted CXXCH cytochrome family protein